MLEVLVIFLFGFGVGSFLNVLIDRLPRDESFFIGRSYCESCKTALKWYDLIPVFSFLFLKARCRYCRSPLSFYYPTVELVTGIMFAIAIVFLSDQRIMNYESGIMNFVKADYFLFILSTFIVVFFTDLKYGIIPDKILFASILISALYLFIIPNSLFLIHFVSAIGSFAFFLLIFLATRGRGMGFGDVKLAFLIGLILGFPKTVVALYVENTPLLCKAKYVSLDCK